MHIRWGVLVIAISCMGTALAMVISGKEESENVIAAPVEKSPSKSGMLSVAQPDPSDSRLDLNALKRTVPRKIKNSELLLSKSWYVPPPAPVASALPPSPPPPPSAPQLPFTYIGRMIDGGEVILFLTGNGQQYTVRQGDVLNDSYRVDSISDKSVVLTYLPMGVEQELAFNSDAVGISALNVSALNTTIQPVAQAARPIEPLR